MRKPCPNSTFTLDLSALLSPEVSLPVIYGIFILWRYYVACQKGKIPVNDALDTKPNVVVIPVAD